jgi:hypothetical protein
VSIILIACKDNITNTFIEKEFTIRTLVNADDGGSYAGNHVFKNDIEYENFYGQVTNGFLFGNEMIVVAYKGRQGEGGHRYELLKYSKKKMKSKFISSLKLVNKLVQP